MQISSALTPKTGATETSSLQEQRLRQSCREFEAIYIQEMYKAMRKTVPESDLLPDSTANTLYRDLLDMELARATAAGDGTGIGQAMYEQLKDTLAAPQDGK